MALKSTRLPLPVCQLLNGNCAALSDVTNFLWSSAYANVYHLLAAGDSCHSNRNNSNNKQRKNEKNYYKKLFAHCATQYKNNHKLLSHSRIFVMCCRRVNCKLWCCNYFTNYVVNFVNHILLATIDFGYLINRTFFHYFFVRLNLKLRLLYVKSFTVIISIISRAVTIPFFAVWKIHFLFHTHHNRKFNIYVISRLIVIFLFSLFISDSVALLHASARIWLHLLHRPWNGINTKG